MSERATSTRHLHVVETSPPRLAARLHAEATHPASLAIASAVEPDRGGRPGLHLAQPTVLIVEDDEKLATLLQRMFRRAGYHTRLAPTGDHALRAMRSEQPEAAVIDIMIPHPDGIEVCRQFRRDGWEGPIVAISARSSLDDRRRVEAAGADTFLTKPFPLAELLTTVEALRDRNDGGDDDRPGPAPRAPWPPSSPPR